MLKLYEDHERSSRIFCCSQFVHRSALTDKREKQKKKKRSREGKTFSFSSIFVLTMPLIIKTKNIKESSGGKEGLNRCKFSCSKSTISRLLRTFYFSLGARSICGRLALSFTPFFQLSVSCGRTMKSGK